MGSPQYITLQAWAARKFSGRLGKLTVLKLAALGRVQPPPAKIGRAFYVERDAQYLHEGPPSPAVADRDDIVEAAVFEQLRVESITHLYRHFDSSGRLLYVGISLSPIERLRKHSETSHWTRSIAKVEIEDYPTRAEALAAEKTVIQAELPLHNIHHTVKAPA